MIPSNVWKECKWQQISMKSTAGDLPYECWFRDHVLGIQSAKVAEYERFFFLWYQSTQFTVMILISLLIKNHVQRLLMVKNQTAKWQIQVRKIIEGCS